MFKGALCIWQVLNLLLLHTLLPDRHFYEIIVYSHEIKNFREDVERELKTEGQLFLPCEHP